MRWFHRRGFFFPASFRGYVVLGIYLVLAITIFIDIDRHSHSVSDTLMNPFFNYILLAAGYTVIGSFTSRKE